MSIAMANLGIDLIRVQGPDGTLIPSKKIALSFLLSVSLALYRVSKYYALLWAFIRGCSLHPRGLCTTYT